MKSGRMVDRRNTFSVLRLKLKKWIAGKAKPEIRVLYANFKKQ